MRKSIIVATTVATFVLYGTILVTQSSNIADAQVLTNAELSAFRGGSECDKCKGGGGENCQQCNKTGTNQSKKYSAGGQAMKCTTEDADEGDHCLMSGIMICGTNSIMKYWVLNENCNGLPQRTPRQRYTIDDATGNACD